MVTIMRGDKPRFEYMGRYLHILLGWRVDADYGVWFWTMLIGIGRVSVELAYTPDVR